MTDISEKDIQVVLKWLDGGCSSWGVPADQIHKLCLDHTVLEAKLAEARKALGEIEQEARSLPLHTSAVTWEHVLTSKLAVVRDAARRALEGGE